MLCPRSQYFSRKRTHGGYGKEIMSRKKSAAMQDNHRSGLLIYFLSQDNVVVVLNSEVSYENCLIRHIETHFILPGKRPDGQVCGRKWNKYGTSGRSEWLGWHLLWLAFVVLNAFLSSSDSPSLSRPPRRSRTLNFPLLHADVRDLYLSCRKTK